MAIRTIAKLIVLTQTGYQPFAGSTSSLELIVTYSADPTGIVTGLNQVTYKDIFPNKSQGDISHTDIDLTSLGIRIYNIVQIILRIKGHDAWEPIMFNAYTVDEQSVAHTIVNLTSGIGTFSTDAKEGVSQLSLLPYCPIESN